jgi:nucleoside-diphosphate-sugar epimerase
MRVFVAGATGAIGYPLVAALIRRGHEVTARRDPSKAPEPSKPRVRGRP